MLYITAGRYRLVPDAPRIGSGPYAAGNSLAENREAMMVAPLESLRVMASGDGMLKRWLPLKKNHPGSITEETEEDKKMTALQCRGKMPYCKRQRAGR